MFARVREGCREREQTAAERDREREREGQGKKGRRRAKDGGEAARSETKLVAFRGTRAVWKRRRERDKRGSRG